MLLNTIYATTEVLDTIEEDYQPAVEKYDIPVISIYNRWYGSRSFASNLEQMALARYVRTRYMVDNDHFSDCGHYDIASFVILQLQEALHRITAAINATPLKSDAASRGDDDSPVSPLWTLSSADGGGSETHCAIAFNVLQLSVEQLKAPLIARGFAFEEASGASVAKMIWRATGEGAELAFDCLALASRRPPLNVDRVYMSYLGTWSPQAGAALMWISADVTFRISRGDGVSLTTNVASINATTPRRFDSHWALSQTTATAKSLQLYSPIRLLNVAVNANLSLDSSVQLCLSERRRCVVEPQFHTLTLHVLTVDFNKTFSFVGFFIRVRR